MYAVKLCRSDFKACRLQTESDKSLNLTVYLLPNTLSVEKFASTPFQQICLLMGLMGLSELGGGSIVQKRISTIEPNFGYTRMSKMKF